MSTNTQNTTTLSSRQKGLIHELAMQATGDNYHAEGVDSIIHGIENGEFSWSDKVKSGMELAKSFQENEAANIAVQPHTVEVIRAIDSETKESTETENMTEQDAWKCIRKLRYDHGLNTATSDQWHECRRRLQHAGLSREEITEKLQGLRHCDVNAIFKEYEKAPSKKQEQAS